MVDATVAVGAIVRDSRGRVLLVRRARPPSVGIWTLPGGKVEPGESPARAIVREVKEETGLDVRVVCFVIVYALRRDGWAYDIHEHLCALVDEAQPLVPGDDAADARWVERAELAALGVNADTIAVIERAVLDHRGEPV